MEAADKNSEGRCLFASEYAWREGQCSCGGLQCRRIIQCRTSYCSKPRPLLPRRSAIFSISVNDSFAQGFHGRFGRPRAVFFFATPSMPPTATAAAAAAGGRPVRSGYCFEVPPNEAESDTEELRCTKRTGSDTASLGSLATFRLCFL